MNTNKHPEWVIKHKRSGTEIRLIKGHYYLYEITSKWDKEKKRAVKKTIGILGKITEDGFIESDKHRLKNQKTIINRVVQKEFGFTHLLQTYLSDTVKKLKELFPDCYESIIALSYGRLVYQAPLKNMDFRFKHSFLSEEYPNLALDKNSLTSFMRYLGEHRESICKYFNSFWEGDKSCILFDVSSITSLSKQMEVFPKAGYNNNKNFDTQLNIMFIHSVEQRMPMYYRIMPGNIREVKAFSLSLKEFDKKDITVIADKGFFSNKNINEMNEQKIKYIIPLRRNLPLIDYSKLQAGLNYEKLDGYFKFGKRIIWYYTINSECGIIYLFLDDYLKVEEQRDYLMRIDKYPDEYSIEEYHKKQTSFGTLALLTNTGDSAQKTYENYKSRNDIEVLFDAFKNVLHADRTYMQNDIAMEAWMFINFIAIQWYYILSNLLRKNNLAATYSPLDLVMILSEIKKIKINDNWYLSEITQKTNLILSKLNIVPHIP